MPPLVKVDEDLPESVADAFEAAGYSCSTVNRQGWGGLPDDEIWKRVQAESRWLITADKGFGDVRKFVPRAGTGVVLLRINAESRRAYTELAETAAKSVRLDDLGGCLVVATNQGIRIKRPDEK